MGFPYKGIDESHKGSDRIFNREGGIKIQLLYLGITVLFSAFFSGVETAFISASQVKIEIWVRQKIRGADLALRFLKSPDQFLITTLIGNNHIRACGWVCVWEAEPYPEISFRMVL